MTEKKNPEPGWLVTVPRSKGLWRIDESGETCVCVRGHVGDIIQRPDSESPVYLTHQNMIPDEAATIAYYLFSIERADE